MLLIARWLSVVRAIRHESSVVLHTTRERRGGGGGSSAICHRFFETRDPKAVIALVPTGQGVGSLRVSVFVCPALLCSIRPERKWRAPHVQTPLQ